MNAQSEALNHIVAELPEGEALHKRSLLCGEKVNMVWQGAEQVPFIEALLPDIRLLAIFSAAQRCEFIKGKNFPTRLTDEADWMAARCIVLGASYLQMTQEQLPLLTVINQRIQLLSRRAMTALPNVSAMIMPSIVPDTQSVIHIWTKEDANLLTVVEGNGVEIVALSRQMGRIARKRIAPLLRAFGAAPATML